MKHSLYFYAVIALLACSCSKDIEPTEFIVQTESVGGSRARFSVVPKDPKAYYSYVLIHESEANFNDTPENICKREILRMKESMQYFESGTFASVFCFQGSRQFSMETLTGDADFKFIVFQINPDEYTLLGTPVAKDFHTNPIPVRDLYFDIDFHGDTLLIIPSVDTLTFLWEYESTDLIEDIYGFASNYIYSIASMYVEYGFMETEYAEGPIRRNLTEENVTFKDGDRKTFVVCGCEEGEFTTKTMEVDILYHPGNVEVLEVRDNIRDIAPHN